MSEYDSLGEYSIDERIEQAKNQGAIQELKDLIKHFGTNDLVEINVLELIEYTDKRLKELERVGEQK